MARHNAQGSAAEERALRHLQTHGLVLVERNFRVSGGEIDLVMRQQQTLVFVEVRFRSRGDYGSPQETVTPTKQRRLITAAASYLQRRNLDLACRFDVVAVSGPQQERIEWIQDAFRPE